MWLRLCIAVAGLLLIAGNARLQAYPYAIFKVTISGKIEGAVQAAGAPEGTCGSDPFNQTVYFIHELAGARTGYSAVDVNKRERTFHVTSGGAIDELPRVIDTGRKLYVFIAQNVDLDDGATGYTVTLNSVNGEVKPVIFRDLPLTLTNVAPSMSGVLAVGTWMNNAGNRAILGGAVKTKWKLDKRLTQAACDLGGPPLGGIFPGGIPYAEEVVRQMLLAKGYREI